MTPQVWIFCVLALFQVAGMRRFYEDLMGDQSSFLRDHMIGATCAVALAIELIITWAAVLGAVQPV